MTQISRLFFANYKTQNPIKSEQIQIAKVSIVIPVKDNQKGIDCYLTTFFKTHDKNDFPREIIIVDNNSRTATTINPNYLKYGLDISLVFCEGIGPAAARNYGVSVSKGDWILFNDSDCIPTANLLKGYLKACNLAIAYAGNVTAFGKSRLSSYYQTQEILNPLKVYVESRGFTPQYLITANTLVLKRAFISIGGFNEKIKIAGGEDVDLGIKLSQIGFLSFAYDSEVLHNFNDGFWGFYQRFKRYGAGNRIIQELWRADMKPNIFAPNVSTLFNLIAARLQYLFLFIGYYKMDKKIRSEKEVFN